MPLETRALMSGIFWLFLVLIHHRIPVSEELVDASLDMLMNLLGGALIFAGLAHIVRQ